MLGDKTFGTNQAISKSNQYWKADATTHSVEENALGFAEVMVARLDANGDNVLDASELSADVQGKKLAANLNKYNAADTPIDRAKNQVVLDSTDLAALLLYKDLKQHRSDPTDPRLFLTTEDPRGITNDADLSDESLNNADLTKVYKRFDLSKKYAEFQAKGLSLLPKLEPPTVEEVRAAQAAQQQQQQQVVQQQEEAPAPQQYMADPAPGQWKIISPDGQIYASPTQPGVQPQAQAALPQTVLPYQEPIYDTSMDSANQQVIVDQRGNGNQVIVNPAQTAQPQTVYVDQYGNPVPDPTMQQQGYYTDQTYAYPQQQPQVVYQQPLPARQTANGSFQEVLPWVIGGVAVIQALGGGGGRHGFRGSPFGALGGLGANLGFNNITDDGYGNISQTYGSLATGANRGYFDPYYDDSYYFYP